MKKITILFILILILGCSNQTNTGETTDKMTEQPTTEPNSQTNEPVVKEETNIKTENTEPIPETPTPKEDMTNEEVQEEKVPEGSVNLEIMETLHWNPKQIEIEKGTNIHIINNGRAAQILLIKPIPYDADRVYKLERLISKDSMNFMLNESGTYSIYGTGFPAIKAEILVR